MPHLWKLVFIPLLLINQSCDLEEITGQNDKKPISDTFRVNSEIGNSRKYNDSEFEVAKRVCQNLKHKRQVLSIVRDRSKTYNFRLTQRDCLGASTRTSSPSATLRTSGSELRFDSRSDLIDTLLTDEDEVMNIFCDDLLLGNNRNNIEEDGSLRYKVTFFAREGVDFVLIGKFVESRGQWRARFVDEASVVNRDYGSYPKGTVIKRVQESYCDGRRITAITSQTLNR